MQHRIIQKHERDVPVVQPWPSYIRSVSANDEFTRFLLIRLQVMPSSAYEDNPITSMCTKFVHTSINKMRCPINVAAVRNLLGCYLAPILTPRVHSGHLRVAV